jgi:hypothetical protein
VVGFTTGSRGEVPGKRKPVIRDHDDDNDNSFSVLHQQPNGQLQTQTDTAQTNNNVQPQ